MLCHEFLTSHFAGSCTEQHVRYPTDIIIARELQVRITAKLIHIHTLHLQLDDSSPCNAGSQIEVLGGKKICLQIVTFPRMVRDERQYQKYFLPVYGV